jgi:transcriptional regulator with XRE-family HTH domain
LSILIDTSLEPPYCRKMSKRRTNRVVRHEIATRLREALDLRRLTISEAAKLLGVTRQALWLYVNEKAMPGGRVLERACRKLDLSLTVNGFLITKEAFGPAIAKTAPSEQYELFRAFAEITPDQIETKLVRSSKDLFELRVRIKKAS